jgi:hypothetical protein
MVSSQTPKSASMTAITHGQKMNTTEKWQKKGTQSTQEFTMCKNMT